MNLKNVFPGLPDFFWQELIQLSKCGDWLETKYLPTESGLPRTGYEVNWWKIKHIRGLVRTFERDQSGLFLLWNDTMAKIIRDGVKMFRPSFEQCEAMEHVKINLPISDYCQPYPAMIVEFPAEYRESLSKRAGRQVPQFLVVQWNQERKLFFSGCSFFFDKTKCMDDLFYVFQERPEFPTIEDALQTHHRQAEAEEVISEAMTRVVMNLCMFLSDAAHRVVPSNPKALDKAKAGEKMPGGKGEANRTEAATHVSVLKFEQDIIVRKVVTENRTEIDTGRTVKPHWRHGYRRRQHYGPGNSQVKKVFIPPVFVNITKFTGDLGNTSVVYRDPSINKDQP